LSQVFHPSWWETCRVIQQQFWMKGYDIFGGGKTYSDPSTYFQGTTKTLDGRHQRLDRITSGWVRENCTGQLRHDVQTAKLSLALAFDPQEWGRTSPVQLLLEVFKTCDIHGRFYINTEMNPWIHAGGFVRMLCGDGWCRLPVGFAVVNCKGSFRCASCTGDVIH